MLPCADPKGNPGKGARQQHPSIHWQRGQGGRKPRPRVQDLVHSSPRGPYNPRWCRLQLTLHTDIPRCPQLVSLPDSFSRLTGLVELFLTDNRLETLPDGERGDRETATM